jgi:uncharacterized protein (DUF488 family)
MLFSIGHGTRPAEEFVQLLQKYNVVYLIDVRSTPRSRYNPQYNQTTLDAILSEHDMKYVFMGDTLGGRPKDEACYDSKGKIDYQMLASRDFFKEGVDRLKVAADKKLPAAIMCSERKPQDCHRSKLIGKMLLEEGVNIKHIDENGDLILQEQLEQLYKL